MRSTQSLKDGPQSKHQIHSYIREFFAESYILDDRCIETCVEFCGIALFRR